MTQTFLLSLSLKLNKTPTPEIPAKQVYQFLKQALSKVRADKPFRGPDNFKKGDFQYQNIVQGTVQNFSGQEKIFYRNKLVYKLYYHGGLIAHH